MYVQNILFERYALSFSFDWPRRVMILLEREKKVWLESCYSLPETMLSFLEGKKKTKRRISTLLKTRRINSSFLIVESRVSFLFFSFFFFFFEIIEYRCATRNTRRATMSAILFVPAKNEISLRKLSTNPSKRVPFDYQAPLPVSSAVPKTTSKRNVYSASWNLPSRNRVKFCQRNPSFRRVYRFIENWQVIWEETFPSRNCSFRAC